MYVGTYESANDTGCYLHLQYQNLDSRLVGLVGLVGLKVLWLVSGLAECLTWYKNFGPPFIGLSTLVSMFWYCKCK